MPFFDEETKIDQMIVTLFFCSKISFLSGSSKKMDIPTSGGYQ